MRSRPLLVLAAWPPELARLRRRLAATRTQRPDVELRAIGVGLVAAAVGATRAIADVRPRAVVLVGTAGVYRQGRGSPSPAPGEAVVVERVKLMSTAAATGRAYLPGPMRTELSFDERLTNGLRGAGDVSAAAVGCPIAITKQTALAARIARAGGVALENLEAFAVAEATVAADVPAAAVLGIANVVGPAAHAEWRQHGRAAAAVACDVVWRWLRADV